MENPVEMSPEVLELRCLLCRELSTGTFGSGWKIDLSGGWSYNGGPSRSPFFFFKE